MTRFGWTTNRWYSFISRRSKRCAPGCTTPILSITPRDQQSSCAKRSIALTSKPFSMCNARSCRCRARRFVPRGSVIRVNVSRYRNVSLIRSEVASASQDGLGTTIISWSGMSALKIILFSIITATFNSSGTIERNIRSVQEQNHSQLQHLVIDNCSTDDTLERVKACRSPFIEILCERDSGIYDAFNKGVARARGDVIAILNADDYYLPGTIEAVRLVLERDPEVAIVHGNTETTRNGRPVKIGRAHV